MGESETKFQTPLEIVNDAEVSFYCNADDCNVEQGIKDAFKDDGPLTLEAMKAVQGAGGAPAGADDAPPGDGGAPAVEKDNMGVGGEVGGAAQTTVAVATIAFSMVMARLAL